MPSPSSWTTLLVLTLFYLLNRVDFLVKFWLCYYLFYCFVSISFKKFAGTGGSFYLFLIIDPWNLLKFHVIITGFWIQGKLIAATLLYHSTIPVFSNNILCNKKYFYLQKNPEEIILYPLKKGENCHFSPSEFLYSPNPY